MTVHVQDPRCPTLKTADFLKLWQFYGCALRPPSWEMFEKKAGWETLRVCPHIKACDDQHGKQTMF